MKSVLLLILISLISCQTGGWTKRSLAENSFYIDRSFTEAYKSYSNEENIDYDNYIRLSVYSQIVSGTNYKVCFIDPKADYPKIQEFVVYVPLSNGRRNGPEFKVIQHKEYEGGKTYTFEAPIDKIPLLIKQGSILPFGKDIQYADENPNDELEIRVYQGADGEFLLYEDEGDNLNYQNGKYSLIRFKYNESEKTLKISKREGNFEGMKQ